MTTAGVPKLPKRRAVGLALTAFDIWRRLPPRQRRPARATATSSTGPLIGAQAVRSAKRRRDARASLATRAQLEQRCADDPVLLAQVRGRVALARARAPRPADVAQRDARGQRLLEAVPDRPPGAHVLRLLLRPDDLLQVRVRPRRARRAASIGNG